MGMNGEGCKCECHGLETRCPYCTGAPLECTIHALRLAVAAAENDIKELQADLEWHRELVEQETRISDERLAIIEDLKRKFEYMSAPGYKMTPTEWKKRTESMYIEDYKRRHMEKMLSYAPPPDFLVMDEMSKMTMMSFIKWDEKK